LILFSEKHSAYKHLYVLVIWCEEQLLRLQLYYFSTCLTWTIRRMLSALRKKPGKRVFL